MRPPRRRPESEPSAADGSSPRKSTRKKSDQMAPTRSSNGDRPALVIVESPKKARSIGKFLGSVVTSSRPAWATCAICPSGSSASRSPKGYKPSYEVVPAKKETIGDLKRTAARSGLVYLATDPDREGEAIAWHLQQALGLDEDRIRRVTFHEITDRAVKEAFTKSGPINMDMVNAQQARRFLDRVVGYQLSPLLWKKVGARNLSAGPRAIGRGAAHRRPRARYQEFRHGGILENRRQVEPARIDRGRQTASRRPSTEFNGAKFEAKNEADAHADSRRLAGGLVIKSRRSTRPKSSTGPSRRSKPAASSSRG